MPWAIPSCILLNAFAATPAFVRGPKAVGRFEQEIRLLTVSCRRSKQKQHHGVRL